MYLMNTGSSSLSGWINEEVEFPGDRSRGDRGAHVERLQEWLSLHHSQVVIDGIYGPATEEAVRNFQARSGIFASGVVDSVTHDALVAPMVRTLQNQLQSSIPLGEAIVAFARAHLAEHPREVGGDNCGPWVRLYMDGHDGRNWFWCAGFTTFCMKQAAEALGTGAPVDGSFSCDNLVDQGRDAGLYVAERDASPDTIKPGSFFFVRKTPRDWTHVGIVTDAGPEAIKTIEGNTNDDGHRNGYEVCDRVRGYARKDFIVF